jgi:tetratricopeptide (TPR) repeat protein
MFDFGFLTVPALAALSVFVTALFVGEEIVIDKIQVSSQLEWSGYTTVVATRELSDELRELGVNAASELTGIEIDETSLEKGVEAFEDYFEIASLINGTRNLFGMIPYYINGEITEKGGEATFIARVYSKDNGEESVKLVTAKGDPKDLRAILHEGALGILEEINPYIVALYHRQTETETRQFEYPETQAAIRRYLASRPVEEHFLAYGLLGRMHMLKAERDTSLGAEGKEAEYDAAMRQLHASLRQKPDFLYPLINLGLIHAARGEVDLADRYYARAVEVNPDYLLTRTSWGDMLVRQGRVNDAIIQYVAAVEIEPEDGEIRDKLAGLYIRAGRPDAAREQWEEALLIEPTNIAFAENIKALGGDPATGAEEKCGPGLLISCY